jgi:hypothetical protein
MLCQVWAEYRGAAVSAHLSDSPVLLLSESFYIFYTRVPH